MLFDRREELEPLVTKRKDNWRWLILLSFSFFSFSSALMFVLTADELCVSFLYIFFVD